MKVEAASVNRLENGMNFFLRLDSLRPEEKKVLESLEGKVVGSIRTTFTDQKTGRGFLTILAFKEEKE